MASSTKTEPQPLLDVSLSVRSGKNKIGDASDGVTCAPDLPRVVEELAAGFEGLFPNGDARVELTATLTIGAAKRSYKRTCAPSLISSSAQKLGQSLERWAESIGDLDPLQPYVDAASRAFSRASDVRDMAEMSGFLKPARIGPLGGQAERALSESGAAQPEALDGGSLPADMMKIFSALQDSPERAEEIGAQLFEGAEALLGSARGRQLLQMAKASGLIKEI